MNSAILRGALAGLWALGILAGPARAQGDAGIKVGSAAPVISINDLDGQAVDLGQWIGKKPVLLEFWATWCENCEALLPRVQEAKNAVGDRVEFLGINVTVNQTPERVRRYLEHRQVPFQTLYDDQGTGTRAYQAPATSFVVIIDSAGKVVYTGVGGDQPFEPALKRAAGVKE